MNTIASKQPSCAAQSSAVSPQQPTSSAAAAVPKPSSDALMAQWRQVADDVRHLSLPEQRLTQELRQAHHALARERATHAAFRAQSEETLRALQCQVDMLRALQSSASPASSAQLPPANS